MKRNEKQLTDKNIDSQSQDPKEPNYFDVNYDQPPSGI